jgi:hypothetical protein
MNKINATGRATIRLTDKNTGRVTREITAKNTLNADYAAELKNTIFMPNAVLNVYLSDFDQPAPANGLIFPMGNFLGYGKYGAVSANPQQGTWAANFAKMLDQKDGLTSSTLVWDFTDEQAVGTIRSLFLYLDTNFVRYPSVTVPGASWSSTPLWNVENKIIEVAAKTATAYNVLDLYTKQVVSHAKVNTLTLSGIARDVDTGHIFIFDAATKKLHEFESVDSDFTTANMLNTYNCTGAYFGKGLIKGDYLYYLAAGTDPLATANATQTGAALNLFRYGFKLGAVPEIIGSISAAEIGFTQFLGGTPGLFVDDALVYFQSTSGTGICPVLRMVGDTPKIGFTGGYSATSNQVIQRILPDRSFLVCGSLLNGSSYPINKIPPMAVSHLLLPEPIIKDNAHRLSVSYTISIQD